MFGIAVYSLLLIVQFNLVSASDLQLSKKHFYIPNDTEMNDITGGCFNKRKCVYIDCFRPYEACAGIPAFCADCCYVCVSANKGFTCTQPSHDGKNCVLSGGYQTCGQLYRGDCVVPAIGVGYTYCVARVCLGVCGNVYNNCID